MGKNIVNIDNIETFKYKYIIKNPLFLRFVYSFGVISWVFALYGYYRFMNLNLIYWLIFAPFVAYFSIYYGVSNFINLFYKRFDVNEHNLFVKKYWNKLKRLPNIDIFLPTCGEPIDILNRTYVGVKNIDYKNKKIYVLDDKGDEKVKKLAKKFGFIYLSRPNKGHMKKAGNLKFGYEHSKGEFIIIFDADFVPASDFIHELLPYMSDKKNAIVQSPQYFPVDDTVHKRSSIEYGAGQVQEDFYRVIQVARDTFDGAICVGSNAIYRRTALEKVGGTAQIEHSEDVYTGFNLLSKGYKVKYIPLILAIGLCPSDLHTFFHQQYRWCSGSMSLLFSNKFWQANITTMQKICFMCGFMYYISHPLIYLWSFQAFLLLFFNFEHINLINAAFFYPSLTFAFLLLPLFRVHKYKRGVLYVKAAHIYSYSYAFFSKIFNQALGWHPTNSRKKNISEEFYSLLKFNLIYVFFYLLIISLIIALHRFPLFNINYYGVLFWIIFNFVCHLAFTFKAYQVIENDKRNKADKSEFEIWRLTRAGSYIGLLFIVVSSATVYSYFPIKYNNRPTLVTYQAEQIATKPADTKDRQVLGVKTYVETAQSGDSITLLSDRAIDEYEKDMNKQLTSLEKIYVETNLTHIHYQDHLSIGNGISFSSQEIVNLIDKADNIGDIERQAWEKYL